MFLSPLDVHVNPDSPSPGAVTKVEYHPGPLPARVPTKAVELNEWTEVWFDAPGGPVVVRQIVGILARRIVCRLTVGQQVAAGDRFGVMKFGSRIDMFLPVGDDTYKGGRQGGWRRDAHRHAETVNWQVPRRG